MKKQSYTAREARCEPIRSSAVTPSRGRRQQPSMAAAGEEWVRKWADLYAIPFVESWGRTVDEWMEPWMQVAEIGERRWRGRVRSCRCGCTCCEPDDCACRCCISDADLVVYARVGEQRVVPLVVENHRRRKRDVTLDLSDWTSHHDEKVNVTAEFVSPSSFVLEACGQETVLVRIQAAPATEDDDTPRNRVVDVEDCTVFYADLRVKGCDIRSIRIALALLPYDCEDYVVDCRCSCC